LNLDSILSAWLIWFVLGIGLAFLELMMPGFIVLFFGIGCWVVAGALLIWNLTLAQQVGVFIVATIASIVLLRKFLMRVFRGLSSSTGDEGFNDFPKGVHAKVVRQISPNSLGRIIYRGAPWDATSDEEIMEGEEVKLIRYTDNSRLVFFVKKT
jgi:membrane protein implicated in regulation of membrane protease activity